MFEIRDKRTGYWYGVFIRTRYGQVHLSKRYSEVFIPVTSNPEHKYRFLVDVPSVMQYLLVTPCEKRYQRAILNYLRTQQPDIVSGNEWFIPHVQPEQYYDVVTGRDNYPYLSTLELIRICAYWRRQHHNPMKDFLDSYEDIPPTWYQCLYTTSKTFPFWMITLLTIFALRLLYVLF